MWLLDVRTSKLREFNVRIPPYSILSHTWATEEVLFKDMADLKSARRKSGWKKVQYMCQQSIKDGLSWTWIDTCCIDKSSSAELSEAINSMFRWYREAEVCHVYLSDAFAESNRPPSPPSRSSQYCWGSQDGSGRSLEANISWSGFEARGEPHGPPQGASAEVGDRRRRDSLAGSRWWRRGWTLQELIAPTNVVSWDPSWNCFGSLVNLIDVISRITGIEEHGLLHVKSYREICVGKRLSWAANRETTRDEDAAYSLLGILDVNMPILYGEGQRAFRRLQQEFTRTSTDLSILAWSPRSPSITASITGALASGPGDFAFWATLPTTDSASPSKPFALTDAGLRVELPCVPVLDAAEGAIQLPCGDEGDSERVDKTTWLLADVGLRVKPRYNEAEVCLWLVLVPSVESTSTDDDHIGVYQARLVESVWWNSYVRNSVSTRLAAIPPYPSVIPSSSQLYIKTTSERDSFSRSGRRMPIDVRTKTGGPPQILRAHPPEQWNDTLGIFSPAKNSDTFIRPEVGVAQVQIGSSAVCLCVHHQAWDETSVFMPQDTLEEAYHAASNSPYSHSKVRCRERPVHDTVLSLQERVHANTVIVTLEETPLGEIPLPTQQRWASDPDLYAPFDLATGRRYVDQDMQADGEQELASPTPPPPRVSDSEFYGHLHSIFGREMQQNDGPEVPELTPLLGSFIAHVDGQGGTHHRDEDDLLQDVRSRTADAPADLSMSLSPKHVQAASHDRVQSEHTQEATSEGAYRTGAGVLGDAEGRRRHESGEKSPYETDLKHPHRACRRSPRMSRTKRPYVTSARRPGNANRHRGRRRRGGLM